MEIIPLASDQMVRVLSALMSQIVYQFRLPGIIKTFLSDKDKLISTRNVVLDKAQATNNKTEKVNDEVLKWLNEAEKLLEEEMQMEIEIETNSNGCFLWTCSAEKYYKLYHEMQTKMQVLSTKCDEFEPFYIPIPRIDYFSYGSLVCFKCTEDTSEKLLEALQDDSCYRIGLHGMRGSGKTKLVKAVGEKAKFLKIFDEVIFVSVSQDQNVKRIHEEIADWFDLKLDRSNIAVRAKSISLTLQSEKRILVILDDVQAKLELEDIGIPYNSNRCKVLLTTHHQQVCTLMGCEREIPLYPLSEEEAWKLFKKHSGIDNENDQSSTSSNLLKVASKVAIECKGLPLTIRDVGSSLRRKPIEEWEATLDGLRHASARYQVFLSFRGEDTRLSFTGFLYDALCREGFKTFMDDGALEGGDQISISLIAAIEASRLSIIVLSENYAHSSWCLDELVTILECNKTKDQLVWPIFYKVVPTDVRHQKNSYGKAMEAHEDKYGKDSEKVQKWRSALFEVAGLSGDHYTTGTGYEYQFIQKIVGKVNNNKRRLYIQNMDMDDKR